MGDIKSKKLLYVKGALFLVLGGLAATNVLLYHPSWQVAVSLLLAIWAFCRAYYFVFYVIEHYIDDEFRFASLWQFLLYLKDRRRS